ncbi:MAG: NlpC/P60 family protein [Candidatus Puniceispirillaceae bacterium]
MTEFRIITPSAPLHSGPAADAPLDNEGLFGETFKVTGSKNGFVFGSLITDGYEGWIPKNCLGDLPVPNARLIAPMTHVTLSASVKSPSCFSLSFWAVVNVINTKDDRAKISTATGHGFLPCRHIELLHDVKKKPSAENELVDIDWVGFAERLINAPYKWGGRTAWGLDCSALVQLSLAAAGLDVPRDSGPQHEIGAHLDIKTCLSKSNLRRGDLVFWEGHVGIMQDHHRLLHANAHHMAVVSESLEDAITRIFQIAGPITALRRPLF